MSLLFPAWFQTTFPKAFQNLEINRARLTTALDIHATLKHLLSLENDVVHDDEVEEGVNPKAISLLRPIPATRDCQQAGIETHWCGCLNWAVAATDR